MRDIGVVRLDEARCIAETDKAICCEVEDEEVWVPKSVIHDDSEVYRLDDTGTLVVPEWFARKNGLL